MLISFIETLFMHWSLSFDLSATQLEEKDEVEHSMATANLKKSEDFVTNTTAASKYIPRRPRISIN